MQTLFHLSNDFMSLIYARVCPSLCFDIIIVHPKWMQLISNCFDRVKDGKLIWKFLGHQREDFGAPERRFWGTREKILCSVCTSVDDKK